MPTPNTEEKRHMAASDACRAEEQAVKDQIEHPRRSILFPEAKRLTDSLKAIKLKCDEKRRALREYRQRVRDRWR
jgi:hypothetical protein